MRNGAADPAYGTQGLATLAFSQGSLVVSPLGRVTTFAMRPFLGTEPPQFGIAALDAAGARDTGFESRAVAAVNSCAGAFDPAASTIRYVAAAQTGERIVVAARWTRTDANQLFCVSRLNADGNLDTTFGVSGHQTFMSIPPNQVFRDSLAPFRVLVREDGGILVLLSPPLNSGSVEAAAVLLLTATGSKDPLLQNGISLTPILLVTQTRDAVLQPNGKFVGVGISSSPGVPALPLLPETGKVYRSSATVGIYDAGFGPFRGGYTNLQVGGLFMVPEKVAIGTDGAILVGGRPSTTGDGMLMRFR
jgi:hypothetical protein